jgi:hypothetical protein
MHVPGVNQNELTVACDRVSLPEAGRLMRPTQVETHEIAIRVVWEPSLREGALSQPHIPEAVVSHYLLAVHQIAEYPLLVRDRIFAS